jgi:hypothetical protein
MQCKSSGALGVPSETKAPAVQNTRYGTAIGRNDSTNKNSYKKNSWIQAPSGEKRLRFGSSTGIEGPRREGERTLFRKGEDRRQIPGAARDRK